MRTNLDIARKAKYDEFYTLYDTIEKEILNYIPFFKNKVVLCNCNDGMKSNFFKFFKKNFKILKLKSLISISFKEKQNHGIVYFYDGIKLLYSELVGDGSFDSEESLMFLSYSDIVVTNPPFSLFRFFLKKIIDLNKKFIVLGNINACSYKEVFPLVKENKIRLGYSITGGGTWFNTPCDENIEVSNVRWFTNFPVFRKRLELTKVFCVENYPVYDNHYAINVDKTMDIPFNYNGVMGVPITFLDKYNPHQFKIIGIKYGIDGKYLTLNGKQKYVRILIKRR